MDDSRHHTANSTGQRQVRSDALERVSDGVVALNHDLRYTYVNTPAADLLDTSAESLLGEFIWDVFPEPRGTTAQDAIERAIETGQITSFERYNQELEQWWDARVHPDDTGITIVFSDVTERKERLYDLERADTVFQNAQDGLFVIDIEDGGETFRINQVNPAYEAFTGTSAGELKGKTIREVADEADSARVREKYSECVSKRTPLEYEEHLSAFEGGSWWETRIAPIIVDDEVTQIVGSTRNITDRKEREQRLRKFEQMVRNTGHAVFFTDADGQIKYVNPAFEDLTGYTAADALGETPHLLNSGEHDDAFFADLWETVLDGNVWSGEIVNERKDGTQFVAKHTIAPVRDDSGAVTHLVAIYDDITERKERERRLQTHELVVQTMNEEAFLVDNQRRIRFANDAALDFVDASRAEIEGQPVGSVTEGMAAPDEEPQRFLNAIDSLLDDVEPDVGEWVRESDGTKALSLEFDFYVESIGEVYAEQRLVPVEFYDGERGVAVISRDITKRREREREIQTHLVQAQEIGHVGSWYLNLDANELQWSDECYRIFGLEPGTPMTYERFLDMVHPEDREQVDEAWDSALKDGSYDIEHRIVVDGETRWVQETAEIEFDANGEPESGIGVVRDITDQVQQTREIRTRKQRYESLFNNISGAIVVTDLDGHIRTCNPRFTDLFGYDSDRVRGDHLSTITGDDADVERLLEPAAVSQEPRIVTYRKNSGQIFPGESRSSPLRTHDDDITGHIIHIIDISERRRNRKQLQVLGRLLRHNVKNDMNVIIGLAEQIKAHGSNVVTPHAEKILEKSRTFVGRAENQQRITELLTGQTETDRLDLVPVVKSVVSDVQQQYPDATLETDLAADCPTITTHEIKEAIRELVENAVVHSEQESPSVNIRLRCADGITELKIRDDGPGIPEQEWKVLTEEWEINPLHHGTGLGLWFVNEVIRHSNGTVSFDGNDSGGSTVAVRLPTG